MELLRWLNTGADRFVPDDAVWSPVVSSLGVPIPHSEEGDLGQERV